MENPTASVLSEEIAHGHSHHATCNDETKEAIEELESGGVTRCDSLEELYRSLDGESRIQGNFL